MTSRITFTRGGTSVPAADGARGTRTPDLLGAIQALFQLSYGPAEAASVSVGMLS